MSEQTIELAAGESKQVTFEAVPKTAGTFQVSVEGLTGSFVVIEAAVEHDVTVALKNIPANADQWDMWVADNNMTDYQPYYGIPVNYEVVFSDIPDSWYPLNFMLTVYTAPYVHPGHTEPARDVILGIQSFRQYLLGGEPDPSYRDMKIASPGKIYYDFATDTFTQ